MNMEVCAQHRSRCVAIAIMVQEGQSLKESGSSVSTQVHFT